MKVYKSKLIDENNIKKTYKLGLREFCILLIVSLLCNQALYATDKSEHINNISQNTNVIIGVVTDSQNGDPIIGATIKIKGSTTGTVTDLDGKFEIKATANDILQISYVGYNTKEIKVGKQKVIAVTLAESAEQLETVVVTAFGANQKKESVTGAIQAIKPADLIVPSSNLSTSFAGRLAGVVAFQRSGEPGSNNAEFFIRGISTISGITSPLIIMDGVEITSADLNAIDPEIIESFSILKDATASAMYGTRGANGVMIIKTKSGLDTERPIIGLRVEANISMPTQVPKFVDAITYMKMFNESVRNQGTGDPLYSDEKILGTQFGLNPYVFPNVDWYDEVFKDIAFNQRANLNIRGGTSKITYFMNINVNHETGMLKNRSKEFFSYGNNINLMRYVFQNNIDFHLSPKAKIGLHLNVQLNDQKSPYETSNFLYSAVMSSNPVQYPVYYPQSPDESWVRWGGNTQAQNMLNPVARLTRGYRDTFESTVLANIDYSQKLDFITEGLSLHALFSLRNYSYSTKARVQDYNSYELKDYSVDANGNYTMKVGPTDGSNPQRFPLANEGGSTGERKFYFQSYLDYTRSFNEHHVNAMILFNMDEYSTNNPGTNLISSLPKRRMGVAGRITYDYAHRYMTEVNAGYNGSENFAKGHRWGFFPSISLGWNVAEEPFWESLKNIVSRLKVRGSYGLVGNDQIGSDRYIYLEQVNLQGSSPFQTGYGTQTQTYQGPTYNRFRNEDITWEVGHKLNVGLDLQLFNDWNITFDVFREIRSNIFQQKLSIPQYLGTASSVIYGNFAKVRNHGVDLSIDYGKQISKDFTLQFKGTFTFARNKVLKYDEAPGLRPGMKTVGRRLNTFLGYVTNGLYENYTDVEESPTSTLGNIAISPGDIKYVDQPDANGNYDGRITSDDRVEIGDPWIPEIVYGFGPSMRWKNWDFSFFFQGQTNVSLIMENFEPFGERSARGVLAWIADDYWSPDYPNVNAKHPRLTRLTNNHNMQVSTYWLRDASFLKLKNVELGYSYKKARFYISGSNLLTISPFKHWDPEVGTGAGMQYPTQRIFNLGIQMSF